MFQKDPFTMEGINKKESRNDVNNMIYLVSLEWIRVSWIKKFIKNGGKKIRV
jgi:hypothetical protein